MIKVLLRMFIEMELIMERQCICLHKVNIKKINNMNDNVYLERRNQWDKGRLVKVQLIKELMMIR